jgi:mono/diheme cytochrome c family protein
MRCRQSDSSQIALSRVRSLLFPAWFAAASFLSPNAGAAPASGAAALPKSVADSLPNAPEKALVLQYCQTCHDLDWILRSGGTRQGWEDRLVRMIRAGATIPRDQIPAVAAYLAKALPRRAAPPDGG